MLIKHNEAYLFLLLLQIRHDSYGLWLGLKKKTHSKAMWIMESHENFRDGIVLSLKKNTTLLCKALKIASVFPVCITALTKKMAALHNHCTKLRAFRARDDFQVEEKVRTIITRHIWGLYCVGHRFRDNRRMPGTQYGRLWCSLVLHVLLNWESLQPTNFIPETGNVNGTA